MPISVPIIPNAGAQSPMARCEEVVAVALQVVSDKIGIVAVGHKAHGLGEKRVVDLDLLEADGALLADDLGKAGDLVDQLTQAHAPDREGKLGSQRKAVEDR
jgi:hypothetical protein